mmetsp:Transcript_20660/g.27878  ORF Transcript_20660/g.27878 Transcript_20660/m.27878 type:complete len:118 (-) Transcript_20660:1002-1355(-)
MVLFGDEGNYLALGLVVSYISGDDHNVLSSLLRLSKRSYEMMRMPVYKQLLFFSSPCHLQRKRICIWRNILHIDKTAVDYEDLKQSVNADPQAIKSVEEVIVLDVARSAHNMPGVDP